MRLGSVKKIHNDSDSCVFPLARAVDNDKWVWPRGESRSCVAGIYCNRTTVITGNRTTVITTGVVFDVSSSIFWGKLMEQQITIKGVAL